MVTMNWLDRLENAVVEIASKIGPILAPAPTAFLVGRASIEHLNWPLPVGVIAALVIECLGLATTGLALDLWRYRKSKRKTDPPAPLALAISLIVVYFIVAIALTVALDINPELARFAPAIFPMLSLAGVSVLALRVDHRGKLAEIERGKTERRQKRNQPAKKRQQIPATNTGQETTFQPVIGGKTRDRAWAILQERSSISGSELGRLLGKSERTGRKLRQELLPLLAGENGREESVSKEKASDYF